jgi:glycerophosphoryl diester phosphodiesterase
MERRSIVKAQRNARSAAILLAPALLAGALAVVGASPTSAAACPQIVGHGGWVQNGPVRQPNHPKGISDQKNWGAAGVEGDLQLTKNGGKAVMWHNTSTNGLSGIRKNITDIYWSAGDDKLQYRTITGSIYQGQTVHTFRQWLDAAYTTQVFVYVEIKGEASQSLLNSSTSIRDTAWNEVIGPINEKVAGVARKDRQEIKLYTGNAALKAELIKRANAAGIGNLVTNQPQWADSVSWKEPPASWSGNTAKWESLYQSNTRLMTNYTKDLKSWLAGKCG